MAWQPQQEPMKELVGYLKSALNPRDLVAQKYATLVRLWRKLIIPDISLISVCIPRCFRKQNLPRI